MKVGGLACVELHAGNAAVRAIFAKAVALNSIWDSRLKPEIQKAMSAKLGRQVVLLNGNYVKQKKGVVSYHGALPMPGAVFLSRKTYDAKTGTLRIWLVVK